MIRVRRREPHKRLKHTILVFLYKRRKGESMIMFMIIFRYSCLGSVHTTAKRSSVLNKKTEADAR